MILDCEFIGSVLWTITVPLSIPSVAQGSSVTEKKEPEGSKALLEDRLSARIFRKKGIEDRSREFNEHEKGVEVLVAYAKVVRKKFSNSLLY